jgi:transcriptional regulator with XRE-family HTH domain
MAFSVAAALRTARTATGISQLELALRLGISQRHLSFVELDRARPSRDLLLAWLRELGAGPSQLNAVLLQAGYAPLELGASGAGTMCMVDPALERTIAVHDPSPGFIFDADWRIVRLNLGGEWLCGLLMPGQTKMPLPIDMLAVLADANGWLARAIDPIPAASALLRQLRAEQWLRPGLRARIDAVEESLLRRFGPLAAEASAHPVSTLFEVSFSTEIGQLAFTAVQTLSGLPQDAPMGAHRAELWFPADARTAHAIQAFEGNAKPVLPLRAADVSEEAEQTQVGGAVGYAGAR